MFQNTPMIQHITKRDIFQIRFSQSDEKIWWKCSNVDFTMVWDPLICWLSRGVLKQRFLENGLTKSFTVCNFRNKVAMAIRFFLKSLKIWFDSRNGTKEWEKGFGFEKSYIWIGDENFSQSRTGYLSLAVNMLRNTHKI